MSQSLRVFFEGLTDATLLARVRAGLTDEALAIARAELARRGLPEPLPAAHASTAATLSARASLQEPYEGDMVILEQDLEPTEAHMLCACLHAAGIPADAGDTHLVQANALLSIAVGGAKLRVPEDRVDEARSALAAFRRGDFALDEDFDVGEEKE